MEFPVPVENDLKRICMVCRKDMGTKPAAETGETHGICPECLKKHIEKREAEKRMAVANEELPKSMDEKAADGSALYGSVQNDRNQVFLKGFQEYRRYDQVQKGGKWYRLVEKDEYPIGTPGWWAVEVPG